MNTITIEGNEFVIFHISKGTYQVLNREPNLERFAKRMAQANKPMKTGAQMFDAERKAQFKLTATPGERARAELYREFDLYTEPEPVHPIITDIRHTMFYIPSFTNSERIAA